MNDNELSVPTLSETSEETAGLIREVNALRRLLTLTLLALLMLGGCLNIYLYRQLRTVRREVGNLQPQVAQMSANYEKAGKAEVQRFVTAMQQFAKTHPDFAPIWTKYAPVFVQCGFSAASTPAAAIPAPSPARP